MTSVPPLEQTVADWSHIRQRWEAWWDGAVYDRPILAVTAPRDEVPSAPVPRVDPETQWTDTEYIIQRTLRTVQSTYYGGEAIPWCWNPISAGHALYFGCTPRFAHDTMWVDPAPDGPDGYPSLAGWQESATWQHTHAQVAAFAQASQGRFFVLPFWGNHACDILATVRGVDRFYLDIALNPDWVRAATRQMSDILLAVHDELLRLTAPEIVGLPGTLNYCGCWSPRRTLAFDCDVSCNVSPRTFREVFLPPLVESMRRVDHRIYHLDGPRALNHLDALLALPELHAIQWVPGAGQDEIEQWLPLLRSIQAAGKGVQVLCRPEEVALVVDRLAPEGLCMVTRCASVREAQGLVALLESRKR